MLANSFTCTFVPCLLEPAAEDTAAGSTPEPAASSSSSSSSSFGLLDELLGRLPTVMNRKFVDEVGVVATLHTHVHAR